jgi:hypothetical protein
VEDEIPAIELKAAYMPADIAIEVVPCSGDSELTISYQPIDGAARPHKRLAVLELNAEHLCAFRHRHSDQIAYG